MNNDVQTTVGSDFKDRTTGLILFGIIEILIGMCFALQIPLMIFGMRASTSHLDARTMIPNVLTSVILAAWFIWLGVGSIQAKRWARALLLVTSWIWLISGIASLPVIVAIFPGMFEQLGKSGQMPQQILTTMKYTMIGFMVVFYIIVPGVFVLFYGSKHTKLTCEKRDPHVRWTDKCPLPVLAFSLISAFSALSMLCMGFYGWTFPFFGSILSGIAGAGVALIGALLLLYAAWGMYRLKINAWWCAILLTITWGVSGGITYSHGIPKEFFEKMNISAQQLEMTRQLMLSHSSLIVLYFGLLIVIALAYLLYIRKYFVQPTEQRSVSQ